MPYLTLYQDPSSGKITLGRPFCHQADAEAEGEVMAATYSNGQRTKSAITICDAQSEEGSAFTYQDLGLTKLHGEIIHTMLLSATLLHEVCASNIKALISV
ncbi:hypothetical protein BJX70DRAFT_377663 [Aspergillus crustosus]